MSKKTLLELYASRTTRQEMNQEPRAEGFIATISDMLERDSTFENLPKALDKVHEFHRLFIDKSKVKDDDELERVATMFTLCFSLMVIGKHCSRNMK